MINNATTCNRPCSHRAHTIQPLWLSLLLLVLALSASGCLVAAAGAAAGAGAYAYYQGNVSETYASDFGQTYQATKQSLTELAMPVRHEEHHGISGTIESSIEDGSHVTISIEEKPRILASDGHQTEVTVRVGVLGDQKMSDKLQQQIRSHLASKQTPPPGVAPTPTAPVPGRLPPISSAPPPIQQTGATAPPPATATTNPGWKPATAPTSGSTVPP